MSRRSRKSRGGGSGGRGGRVALVLLVLAVVGIAAGYGFLRSYLHSDGFRKLLSARVSEAAEVSGEFSPFRWDGLAVSTEGFRATGDGVVTELRAEGLRTEVSLAGVRRGAWELHGTDVSRLEVAVDARSSEENPPDRDEPSPQESGDAKRAGWLPSEVELHGLDVRDVSLNAMTDKGPASARGISVRVDRESLRNVYSANVSGGSVRLPQEWLPEIRLTDARLRYQDGSVFLVEGNARAWREGRLGLAGEWNGRTDQYALEGSASGIMCDELLNETWSQRLTGEISSGFTLDGRSAEPIATGTLRLDKGVLTALPILDVLAAYADTRRFRILTLSEARTDWRWSEGEVALTNFVLASEGLMRVEGRIVVRDRKLDGLFRLGLAPGTLSEIPGAETEVFIAGERGLHWALIRISGTIDDPEEDITDRLVKAAGMRMFERIPETGERALKFTRAVLDEASPRAVEKGVKILGEGEKILREAEGVLDGFFRGRGRTREEP